MIFLLVFFIFSISTHIEGMERRISSSQLKQRTATTVSGKNRLTRSTSGKLERVRSAIKKSTSTDSLANISLVSKKASETQSKETPHHSPSSKKKLHFETLFIDKNLSSLITNFDQDAETALADGDVNKFQEIYKRIESPRAKQEILAKAEKLRGLDPSFCHILVLLSKP